MGAAVEGIEGIDAEGVDGLLVGATPSDVASTPRAIAAISYGREPSTPSTAMREPARSGSGVRRCATLMSA